MSAQTIREGKKFGIEVRRTNEGKVHKGINVTNYERLHYFDPSKFAGVVCDESSAIKQFGGKRRKEVICFSQGCKPWKDEASIWSAVCPT